MNMSGTRQQADARLAVRLPADLLDRARQAAREQDRPLSAVVRRALSAALAAGGNQAS